jgi:tRNA nucleotidyltransferase (CCA-adding enzyme)
VRSHERFGTAKWLLTDIKADRLHLAGEVSEGLPEALDLVSARAEFYAHPSALPEVERGHLKLDLHRRDFTINTLALSLNAAHFGEVYDYWGGLRDLEEKCIRVLHSISFVDDPTRILRAARLEQRLGFAIEPRTRDLIARAQPLLHRVSGDRIRHELEAIFDEPEPQNAMARLQELGILAEIHPGLSWNPVEAGRIQAARSFEPDPRWALSGEGSDFSPSMFVWLAGHPIPILGSILDRLNVPRREAEHILGARAALDRLAALPAGTPPSQTAEALEDASEPALVGAFLASEGRIRVQLDSYLNQWRKVHPLATGETLRRMGLRPGPRYREILRTLRDAWLDGQVGSPEQEERLLSSLIEKAG